MRRMFFKQKIPCYVLIFEQVDIIEKTLAFLADYSEDIELIVIENKSQNTNDIKQIVERFSRNGFIKRHYTFNENITGNAYNIILEHEANFIKRQKYIILTDGDVVSNDRNWLREQKRILQKHKDVFTCGITLDTFNLPLETFPEAKTWLPDDMSEHEDYFETYTGIHLLLMRSKDILGFMKWKKENNLSFVDGNMHAYCYEQAHKKWSRTKVAKAHHLTWDLYWDRDHAYTKFKLAKSFKNTWYHQETADFTLNEFK
jgi:hypothetical protein